MNRSNVVPFVAGAVLGSAWAWLIAKRYYEKISQVEIASVKKTFHELLNRRSANLAENAAVPESPANDIPEPKTDEQESAKKPREKNRVNYAGYSAKINDERPANRPYVIRPDEFACFDDYSQISLTYYADGVLADDDDKPMEAYSETVGEDFADHFGEYEDDAVYIRNERLRCDFEILRDRNTYEEMVEEFPAKGP